MKTNGDVDRTTDGSGDSRRSGGCKDGAPVTELPVRCGVPSETGGRLVGDEISIKVQWFEDGRHCQDLLKSLDGVRRRVSFLKDIETDKLHLHLTS